MCINATPQVTNTTKNVTIIGIAGGTASGKTTLAKRIQALFPNDVTLISQDNYYKPEQRDLSLEEHSKINFDIPEAIDFSLLKSHISDLKQGKDIPKLEFEFTTLKTKTNGVIQSNKIIIIEGILLFASEEVRNEFDFKIFVDADDDIRFSRRIDYYQRAYGFKQDFLVNQYFATVKPGHDTHIAPSKQFADIIIPSNKNIDPALGLLEAFITQKIKQS